MNNIMQYDPVQCQGHEALKVENSSVSTAISSVIHNGSWQLTTEF